LLKWKLSAKILIMQNLEKEDQIINEMFEVGAHYGYSKARRHPSVASIIYTNKNKTDIINLEKTKIMLEKAMAFVEKTGSENKKILFIGTKPAAQKIIKKIAEDLDMPYVIERWIGGTLSNFNEIKKRIIELENYQKENTSGQLEKYTKKERNVLAKKMSRLARYYTGLIGVQKTPDVVFIIDAREEKIAATEAFKNKIPIIALINSDSNLKNIEYPIVANDASLTSIEYFVQKIKTAYKKGKSNSINKEL